MIAQMLFDAEDALLEVKEEVEALLDSLYGGANWLTYASDRYTRSFDVYGIVESPAAVDALHRTGFARVTQHGHAVGEDCACRTEVRNIEVEISDRLPALGDRVIYHELEKGRRVRRMAMVVRVHSSLVVDLSVLAPHRELVMSRTAVTYIGTADPNDPEDDTSSNRWSWRPGSTGRGD